MGFFWEPVGTWIRAHGDGKASTDGQFFTETMKTSTNPPVYRVRVMRRAEVVLEFEMHSEHQPNDDDVVAQLKNRA